MENEKEVVRGSKATAGKVIDGHEIIRQNRRLGDRIMELRVKAGYSRSDFYALLYPDSKEKPTVQEKRMGEIERGNVGQKGAKVIATFWGRKGHNAKRKRRPQSRRRRW